jgi:hypothetical protein
MMRQTDAASSQRDERVDLERYLEPTGALYAFESNMVLLVDPRAIPDDLLETLLTPDGDGRYSALLTDRAIEWYPEDGSRDKSGTDVELKLGSGLNWQMTFCPLCGHFIRPDALAWFSEGRPVCRCCTPNDLVEHSRLAHESADAVAPLGSATDDEWAAAIFRYASNLKKVDSP